MIILFGKYFNFGRIDLILYALLPFTIMVVCSIIINVNLHSRKGSNNLKNKLKLAKHKQLFFILLTTNALFIIMVSPLVFLNATNNVVEDRVETTVAYLLSYANHG